MGQICHPTAFRLGHKDYRWNSGYFPSKDNKIKLFQYNLFISKLIKSIFNTYSLPEYDFENRRNFRNNEGDLVMQGETGVILNPFQKQGIYFSHVFNSYSNSLNINVFFLDQGFLNIKKSLMEGRIRALHYHRDTPQSKKLKYSFFSNFFGYGRLKRKYRIIKKKFILFLRKRRKWNNRNRPWENKWFNFKVFGKLNKRRVNPLAVFDFASLNLNRQKINFINDYADINHYTKLAKVCIKLLSIEKEYKRQTFLVKLLQLLVATLLAVIVRGKNKRFFQPKPMVTLQKLLFFLSLLEINTLKISNYIKSLIYKIREPMFLRVSQIIATNIKAALIPNEFSKYNLNFYGLQLKNINPHAILNFIAFRLSQYIPINPILNEMVNRIRRNSTEIYGFKILVTGRLTRKERASIILRGKGLVQNSKKDSKIE